MKVGSEDKILSSNKAFQSIVKGIRKSHKEDYESVERVLECMVDMIFDPKYIPISKTAMVDEVAHRLTKSEKWVYKIMKVIEKEYPQITSLFKKRRKSK